MPHRYNHRWFCSANLQAACPGRAGGSIVCNSDIENIDASEVSYFRGVFGIFLISIIYLIFQTC